LNSTANSRSAGNLSPVFSVPAAKLPRICSQTASKVRWVLIGAKLGFQWRGHGGQL
jgi:hypothetical protein